MNSCSLAGRTPPTANWCFSLGRPNGLACGKRLKTVFVRQGHYAADWQLVASYPRADVTVDRIADVLDLVDTL